jgi:hypothetical protein
MLYSHAKRQAEKNLMGDLIQNKGMSLFDGDGNLMSTEGKER